MNKRILDLAIEMYEGHMTFEALIMGPHIIQEHSDEADSDLVIASHMAAYMEYLSSERSIDVLNKSNGTSFNTNTIEAATRDIFVTLLEKSGKDATVMYKR